MIRPKISKKLRSKNSPGAGDRFCDALLMRVYDLATIGYNDQAIVDTIKINRDKWTRWMREHPELRTTLYDARANLIEGALLRTITPRRKKEVRKSYNIDTEGNKKQIGEQIIERESDPEIKAIDRLANRYCPDLAPTERKEISTNVVFHVETGVPDVIVKELPKELEAGESSRIEHCQRKNKKHDLAS